MRRELEEGTEERDAEDSPHLELEELFSSFLGVGVVFQTPEESADSFLFPQLHIQCLLVGEDAAVFQNGVDVNQDRLISRQHSLLTPHPHSYDAFGDAGEISHPSRRALENR